MSKNDEPKIIFERKLIHNSGAFRVSIPLELVNALQLEKGDTIQITLEGKKVILWKKE